MRIKNGLVVGVILLFIGVAFQPAIAEQNEVNNNQDELLKFGDFCILLVRTYANIGGKVYDGLIKLKCEDIYTGNTRYRTSGFFGFKLFIGLKIGHTYRITAIDFEKSKTIKLIDFLNYLEIETFEHG